MKAKTLRMKQIMTAPWGTQGNLSYSTFGLSSDGKVYRYDPECEGWLPNAMVEAGASCIAEHKKRRQPKVIKPELYKESNTRWKGVEDD